MKYYFYGFIQKGPCEGMPAYCSLHEGFHALSERKLIHIDNNLDWTLSRRGGFTSNDILTSTYLSVLTVLLVPDRVYSWHEHAL